MNNMGRFNIFGQNTYNQQPKQSQQDPNKHTAFQGQQLTQAGLQQQLMQQLIIQQQVVPGMPPPSQFVVQAQQQQFVHMQNQLLLQQQILAQQAGSVPGSTQNFAPVVSSSTKMPSIMSVLEEAGIQNQNAQQQTGHPNEPEFPQLQRAQQIIQNSTEVTEQKLPSFNSLNEMQKLNLQQQQTQRPKNEPSQQFQNMFSANQMDQLMKHTGNLRICGKCKCHGMLNVECSVCKTGFHARCVKQRFVNQIRNWVCADCQAAKRAELVAKIKIESQRKQEEKNRKKDEEQKLKEEVRRRREEAQHEKKQEKIRQRQQIQRERQAKEILKQQERNLKKQRIEEARTLLTQSLHHTDKNLNDPFYQAFKNTHEQGSINSALFDYMRQNSAHQRQEGISSMQKLQSNMFQRTQHQQMVSNKLTEFKERYPHLVEARNQFTFIKYPIDDKLILETPEIHGQVHPQKPTPKVILASNCEFERLLYIWEFCNNFSEFLDTPKFKLEELRLVLRWGSAQDQDSDDQYNSQTHINNLMREKMHQEGSYVDSNASRQLQETGFNLINQIMTSFVECFMHEFNPSENRDEDEEIIITPQHFQNQENIDTIISSIAMIVSKQDRELVWPELVRILLIQSQSFENFGEYDNQMEAIFAKLINLQPVDFNTMLTYKQKLTLMTVLVDTIHSLDYFKNFLNNRLDAIAAFKRDKSEIKIALKDAEAEYLQIITEHQDPSFIEEQNELAQKLNALNQNFTGQQQEDSKLLQAEIQELQEKIEGPVLMRQAIENKKNEAEGQLALIQAKINDGEVKNKLIGRDALRQEYWFFKDDPTKIYIRKEEELVQPELEKNQESTQQEKQIQYSWCYYDTQDELNRLLDKCLNTKGIRERQLIPLLRLIKDKFILKSEAQNEKEQLIQNLPSISEIDGENKDLTETLQIQTKKQDQSSQSAHVLFDTDNINDCFESVLLYQSDKTKDKFDLDLIKQVILNIEALYTESNKFFKREWNVEQARQIWQQNLERVATCEEVSSLLDQLESGMSAPKINQAGQEVAFSKAQLNFKLLHFKFWPSIELNSSWKDYLSGSQELEIEERDLNNDNQENKQANGWLVGSPQFGNKNALYIVVKILETIADQFFERENVKKEKKEQKEIQIKKEKITVQEQKIQQAPLSDIRQSRKSNLKYFKKIEIDSFESIKSRTVSVVSEKNVSERKLSRDPSFDAIDASSSEEKPVKQQEKPLKQQSQISEDSQSVEMLVAQVTKTKFHASKPAKSKRGRPAKKVKKIQKEEKKAPKEVKRVWQQWCMVCNDGGELICCEGCNHVAHESCLSESLDSDQDWFCKPCLKTEKKIEDKFTDEKPKKVAQEEDKSEDENLECMICLEVGKMLKCKFCSNGAHKKCLRVTLKPGEEFICSSCYSKKYREKHKRKKRSLQGESDSDREWDEFCMICQDGGNVICCDGCPTVVHEKCLGVELADDEDWNCPKCSRMIKQKENDVIVIQDSNSDHEWDEDCMYCNDGGNVVCCDGCKNVAHRKCMPIKPGLNEDWFCEECVAKLAKKVPESEKKTKKSKAKVSKNPISKRKQKRK